MRVAIRLRTIFLALGGFLVLGLIGAAWHVARWSDTPLRLSKPEVHIVESGISFAAFTHDLNNAGILPDRLRFQVLARVRGVTASIQAGEYLLPVEVTPNELLNKVVNGDVLLHQLRIREGETTNQLLARLADDDRISHTLDDSADLLEQLAIDWPFSEGIFYPDTYLVRRGESDSALLKRAFRSMQTHLDEIWRASDASLSKEEALILASIIEKETGQESDRASISQVFHKRLQLGMPLQTDPTVIYALGDAFDGDLVRAHLKIDSPYNTYRYNGLPPGPIALASRASIIAALNPAPGEYLYFVARGDGTTQFSETLEEHNAAVRRFQLRIDPQTR